MRKAFEKKLRFVRIRCTLNLLIEYAGRILAIAGVIAVLAVLTERLFALDVVNNHTLWVFFTGSLLAVVTLWLLNVPTRMQVSLLLDERLRLHERFSTTLALARSQDAFASVRSRHFRYGRHDAGFTRGQPGLLFGHWCFLCLKRTCSDSSQENRNNNSRQNRLNWLNRMWAKAPGS